MHNEVIILKYEDQAGEGRHQFSKKKVKLELSVLFIQTMKNIEYQIHAIR